jgi:hypothetical protein
MVKNYLKIILVFLPFICTSHEDSIIVDLQVVDTTTYDGKTIFVFNDGSWEYEGEFSVIEVLKISNVDSCIQLDQNELYTKNWRNYKTFSLTKNCYEVLDTVRIKVSGAIRPVDQKCNSTFKVRSGRWHNGNDYAAPYGTEVNAVFGGKIRYAQMNYGGFGNLVIIRHPNGLETYYAHLSSIDVIINQDVAPGQVIGKVGSTGHSTGNHLHLECRFMDNPIDPSTIFDASVLVVCSVSFPSMKNRKKVGSFRFSDLYVSEISGGTASGTAIKKPTTRKRSSSSSMFDD